MRPTNNLFASIAAACALGAQPAFAADLIEYEWYAVANNGDLVPDTSKPFNSYNQPAINGNGLVVFRARSAGGEGDGLVAAQPARGIYLRDLGYVNELGEFGPIVTVFNRGGSVPEPVNLDEVAGKYPAFNEFPSVPRIDSNSDTIATRGQSTPVWGYAGTRTGTAGVYANPGGLPTTAASMLGDVVENGVQSFPQFQVPVEAGVPAATGFDQFPGSPAVTRGSTFVFKGNFTANGVARTGVFYRDALAGGGSAPIELIAASGTTTIPGCKPKDIPACKFGSTAPPSAGGQYAVFAGYDNEAAPTKGGIYRVRLGVRPIEFETVAKIGDAVPGEAKGTKFEVFGEAVSASSTGRTILFWGGWGGTHEVAMHCPDEGSSAMRAACDAATNEAAEGFSGSQITTRPVPNKQGFFVRDMQLGTLTPIVKTGLSVGGATVTDFVYWNFSGRVEGNGEGGDDIEEPARWRSATFGAVSGNGVPNISAFKARTADGGDGIYLRRVLPSGLGALLKLLKTGDTQGIDTAMAAAGMVISAVGIERDGFRGNWLALTASMSLPAAATVSASADASVVTGWAGVYAAHFLDEGLVAP